MNQADAMGHINGITADERKAQLLRQGDHYRVALVHAKAQLKHAARPDTLLHSALDHASWALRARVDRLLKPTGASVASIMPFALGLFNVIRKRRLGKPALALTAVLGAASWYLQHRRATQHLRTL